MASAMAGQLKVAYIMSRFPTLTETFILYEMLALERMGVQVEVYPLMRSRRRVHHPECDRFTRRAHFHPFISLKILQGNWHYIRRHPRRYFRLLLDVLRHTLGSMNFFAGAVGIFAKSVRFAYEMERDGVDHVHVHFVNHPAVAGTIITRLTGIPYSFTAHGSDLHVERRMLRQKVDAAAFAVAISEYNKEMIVAECGEDVRGKVNVIHCGVDADVFQPHGRGAESLSEAAASRPLRMVTVGTLIEVKGHRYLIEACDLIRQRGVNFLCQIVGEGKLRRRIEEQVAALGLQNHIRFLGGLPRPQVAQLLQDADVAALTSVPTKSGKREGIPVVLMEAMAAGLPVVASRLSGIPELVRDGESGFLAAPGDVAAIAGALQKLAGDPVLRREMGRAGRSRVLADFDVGRNASKLLELIRTQQVRLAAGSRKGRHTEVCASSGIDETCAPAA